MTDPLLARPLVPVAGESDADHSTAALFPRLDADAQVTVVNIVEKAGGAPDKASVEQREELADEAFALVRERADAAGVAVDTELLYATDVAEAIVDAAHDRDATAIVFTPRGGKRWWDLFASDVSEQLMRESDLPVVMLPDLRAEQSAESTLQTDESTPDVGEDT